jgi:predicted short-subunit dehydrogenase-like oxidoreductase (DUF2520 family)
MKAVFIGSGNLATHLATALHEKGVIISQIYSRTSSNAAMLAEKLGASYTNDPGDIDEDADIYFYALKDSSLTHFLKEATLPNAMHVHTSGSVSLSIFKDSTLHYGVFYPLQTFSKDKPVDFSEIPICLEASDSEMQEKLLNIAHLLTEKIFIINSDQRKVLHLAAVFACNFSNYMYDIASEILHDVGIGFEMIQPLINETAEKVKTMNPYEAQTGPAVRFDKILIEKHLIMLKRYPQYKGLYKDISKQIYNRHKKV